MNSRMMLSMRTSCLVKIKRETKIEARKHYDALRFTPGVEAVSTTTQNSHLMNDLISKLIKCNKKFHSVIRRESFHARQGNGE